MLTVKEWQGEWWAPNLSDAALQGKLSYSPEKGLKLTSKHLVPDSLLKDKKDYYDIILGRTEEGKNITLLGCAFFHNFYIAQFFPKHAIEGMHFPSEERVLLHSMIVHFNSLTNWAGISGFINEPTKARYNTIVHKRPPGKAIGNIGDINVVLRTSVGCSMHRGHSDDRSIKEETVISLESGHKKHIEDFFKAFHSIRIFLSLAMGHATHPRELTGYIGKYAKYLRNKKLLNIYSSLAVSPKEEEALIPPRMLFPFHKIKNKSKKIIDRWVQFYAKYRKIISLYYAVIGDDKMYINDEFLYYVKLLEGFYSIKYGAPKHNLKRKISKLLEDNENTLENITKNTNNYINMGKLINTRDYYTHYNPNPRQERNLLKGTELDHTIWRLRTLFEMCVWMELGINSVEVADAYNRLTSRINMMGLRTALP